MTEPFDWSSPTPDIPQEIEDHARRPSRPPAHPDGKLERCPAQLPWSPDGDGRNHTCYTCTLARTYKYACLPLERVSYSRALARTTSHVRTKNIR